MKYYIFAYDTKSYIDYRIQNSIIKAKLIFICFLFIYLQRFSKKNLEVCDISENIDLFPIRVNICPRE